MPSDTDDLRAQILWKQYSEKQDNPSRNALIEIYSSLTQKIAASLYAQRSGDDVEFEEYLQFGMVGLIESVDRFKLEKGVPFEAFAKHRIRGAILNGLQKMNERREQYAYRARLQKERLNSITDRHGGAASTDLFEEMVEIALGLAICYMLEGTGLIRDPSSLHADQPYQAHELSQLRDRLIESTDGLPKRERFLIQQHYFHQISFSNLSKLMGLTKGRVSQLHKRALLMLRKNLIENQSLDGYY